MVDSSLRVNIIFLTMSPSSYPRWSELPLPDRLWLTALEAEEAGLDSPYVDAIRAGAEALETLLMVCEPEAPVNPPEAPPG